MKKTLKNAREEGLKDILEKVKLLRISKSFRDSCDLLMVKQMQCPEFASIGIVFYELLSKYPVMEKEYNKIAEKSVISALDNLIKTLSDFLLLTCATELLPIIQGKKKESFLISGNIRGIFVHILTLHPLFKDRFFYFMNNITAEKALTEIITELKKKSGAKKGRKLKKARPKKTK